MHADDHKGHNFPDVVEIAYMHPLMQQDMDSLLFSQVRNQIDLWSDDSDDAWRGDGIRLIHALVELHGEAQPAL